MDYEKAYKAALKTATQWVKDGCTDKEKICLECVFPELRESEDERIRKWIANYIHRGVFDEEEHPKALKAVEWLEKQKINTEGDFGRGYDCGYEACLNSHGAEWFEKQKEHPKEELVYRLNGLMQDYIKEGKDDEEKEHRFKCYQLFWNALEDTSYFEQEEQKPVERSLEDDHIIGFVYDLLNEIEWKDNWAMSKEECLRLLSNYRPQKPTEWSNKDEEMMTEIIEFLEYAYPYDNEFRIAWLKSLRGRLKSSDNWKPSEEQMEKEEDGWYLMREAKERLNAMELGISFFGNLFPYLRKRGKLDGLCKLGRRGAQRVWLYDVMGIAEKVKKGELKYKQRWI